MHKIITLLFIVTIAVLNSCQANKSNSHQTTKSDQELEYDSTSLYLKKNLDTYMMRYAGREKFDSLEMIFTDMSMLPLEPFKAKYNFSDYDVKMFILAINVSRSVDHAFETLANKEAARMKSDSMNRVWDEMMEKHEPFTFETIQPVELFSGSDSIYINGPNEDSMYERFQKQYPNKTFFIQDSSGVYRKYLGGE